MKWTDLLHMAASNLRRRRGRTALNLLGIVVGCTTFLMASAGGAGVREALQALFDSSDDMRRVYLSPIRHADPNDAPEDVVAVEGDMSDQRRERIKRRLGQQWAHSQRRSPNSHYLLPETLVGIGALDHITEVIPQLNVSCYVSMNGKRLPTTIEIVADEVTGQQKRIVQGRSLQPNEQSDVLIHEFLAWQLGYHSDAEIEALAGQQLSIEYGVVGERLEHVYYNLRENPFAPVDHEEKNELMKAFRGVSGGLDRLDLTDTQKELLARLLSRRFDAGEGEDASQQNAVTATQVLTIRGVYHDPDYEDPWALFRREAGGGRSGLSVRSELGLSIFSANPDAIGFWDGSAMVDSTRQLREVTDQLEEMGVQGVSSLSLLESVEKQIDRSVYVVYGIAAAVLLITALGISNTLVISVLERTPEFGIMKSLGADDRDILRLMVLEGMICGLLGAILSIGISLLLAIGGQHLLRIYVEQRINREVLGELFRFSAGAMAVTVAGVVLICALASVLPAWRAARLDPVVAMRRT